MTTENELYVRGFQVVVESQRASVSHLQRSLKVGYASAAKIMQALQEAEIVSAPNGSGKRTVNLKLKEGDKAEVKAAFEAAMGHNSGASMPLLAGATDLTSAAREKLKQTVARIERLEEEKKEVAEQIKDVYGEAKAMGYDTKALRAVIRIRKMDREERKEQEAILEVYLDAIGELD